ncbi:MAG: NifU family protein [Rhodomicrobium sp.]
MLELSEQIETAAPEYQPETPEEARFRLIGDAIEELRPRLQRDGGDCHLVSVEGNLVRVKMSGACVGCVLASVTIHGIQEKLIAKLGFPLRVVPMLGGI